MPTTTAMKTKTTTPTKESTPTSPASARPRRVCFSFAAYSKNVIDHIKSCQIPVVDGLTDEEFSNVESSFNFIFPPDLRSILCEGLPVGPGFPNWRSSSIQQLEILINLPILGITKEISKGKFWCETWGAEPDDRDEAVALAKGILKKAPILVPIYRHCYMPANPKLAGNPVFYVEGGDLRYSGFDVAGFFQQIEFRQKTAVIRPIWLGNRAGMKAPAWAAKSARKIEVWSEILERGTCKTKNGTCERWRLLLGDYLEEMSWQLRDGGWGDEEVKEMVPMDGEDEPKQQQQQKHKRGLPLKGTEGVVLHARFLSITLLRAGWSMEDVVYALGFNESVFPNLDSWLETWNIDFQGQIPTTP